MTEERSSLPPAYGVPRGLTMSTPRLLAAYLAGATTGSSPDACIEGELLMGNDHYVAVRLDVAVLVRAEVHDEAVDVHAALRAVLEAHGITLVEENSILAGAMASELAVPRGFEWNLWAADADQAYLELTHRAAGDLPNLSEASTAPAREEGETDARLRYIERGL